jgi:hypothetical protein
MESADTKKSETGKQIVLGRIKKRPAVANPQKKYCLFLLADNSVITFAFVRFGPFIRLIALFGTLLQQSAALSHKRSRLVKLV